MRAVVQRVSEARVMVERQTIGATSLGLLVLVGAGEGDTEADADYVARKVAELRIFEDDDEKMNRSVEEVGGAILVVSQFTLFGDCRKGRRPSFAGALQPDAARPLVERLCEVLRTRGLRVETGRFGEMMDVALVNQGPVTLLLDSRKEF